MKLEDILSQAATAGLLIWPQGCDRLRVRGPRAAINRWAPVLRSHKDALVVRLWTERLRDFFEERAAILEFEAGLPRREAEEQARRATALLARNLGAPWAALRAALNDPALPDAAKAIDRLPYPLPTWCVDPYGAPRRQGRFRAPGSKKHA